MRNHKLQTLHGSQSPFEGLARLDEMVHVGIAESLHSQCSIVGGLIIERRLGKVWQDYFYKSVMVVENEDIDLPVLVVMPPML